MEEHVHVLFVVVQHLVHHLTSESQSHRILLYLSFQCGLLELMALHRYYWRGSDHC